MATRVLSTGDAGYIGSHLADESLDHGFEMHAFDKMAPQVHRCTANLLQILIENPVERLQVASSINLYGEGLYRAADGTLVSGVERSLAQLQSQDCKLRGINGETLAPIPTPETKPFMPASSYALSTRCLTV